MKLSEIVAQLAIYTGKFPRQAIERAIEEREAITPVLLETLEKWKDNLEELKELTNYDLHIYALFLLSQFKETKAYPLIIEFFSNPGRISQDVTEDIVTEHLGRMLASVYDGNIEPIKQLIENPQINEYVRGAALDSLLVLAVQKIISRESVIEYFAELFTTRLEQERTYEQEPALIWTNLVFSSALLCPLELKEDIDRAFESDLVDPFLIEKDDLDYYLELGEDGALEELLKDKHYHLIEDTISEIEWWFGFPEVKPRIKRTKPLGIGKLQIAPEKKSNSQKKAKKRTKNKKQKQARRKNRSRKK